MAAKTQVDLSKIRNLGVIAHIDAGKTTTTEHLLFYSGATHHLGRVDDGNTTTDWNVEEQERGITIYSACIPFQWRDCTVNLIDTPGHVDFTAEVERSLRVLDGAIVVFDAQKGVEAQSETVWRQANKYGVPRLVFINKMDVVGANFRNALEAIRRRLRGNPVPVAIPIGAGSPKDSDRPFAGTIDLLRMKALYFDPADAGQTITESDIPEDHQAIAAEWREKLFDALTAHDEKDRITTAYLEGQEISLDAIRTLIREQTLAGIIQPVLAGSGREHIGIQPLLDAVTFYLPSPLDKPPVVGQNPKKADKDERRKPDPKEPFCGLVFKVVVPDTHNELYYVRIYSGTMKAQSRLTNAGKGTKELISKLYHTLADPTQREELPEAYAGDIVALIGLKDSITGDTLCDTQHPILLEPIQFAQAVVSRTIEPQSSADQQKLTDVLNLLKKTDPTFHWGKDKETGQTLMTGMGMLHLEIMQHRMERDFRLKIRVGQPRVSYRETIRDPRRGEGECNRAAPGAGPGQFARLVVQLEPHQGEQSVLVVNKLKPDTLTPELLAAAEQGVRGALESGNLGYPLMNVKATLLDATRDEQLSTEVAFNMAGSMAVADAMRDNTDLLEPWMKLTVQVPAEYVGSITNDISKRRGEVDSIDTETEPGQGTVIAMVPLQQLFDYADKARSLTQGRAAYNIEPHDYRKASEETLDRLLHPENYI
jgi:elongation factor G